jgi:hypothetical protein
MEIAIVIIVLLIVYLTGFIHGNEHGRFKQLMEDNEDMVYYRRTNIMLTEIFEVLLDVRKCLYKRQDPENKNLLSKVFGPIDLD